MFNWTNTTIPKLTDIFNNTSRNPARIVTYPWVEFLGPWFFALVIGALAGAVYIKYQKPVVPIVFFVVMILLVNVVMPVNLIYIVGIITGFVIGFIFYQLFISEKGG